MKRWKRFWNANSFPLDMLKNYLKFTSLAEKIFDLFFPFLISIISTFYIWNSSTSTIDLIEGLDSINKQSLTSISILAGFNVAGISILASAGSDSLSWLKNKKSKDYSDTTLYEQLMTFFCSTVILQFTVIIIGFLMLICLSFDPGMIYFTNISFIYWAMIGLWLYFIITSIFISVRNLKNLFVILVFTKDN